MKLSVYTIVCNQFSYFNDILLNVDEYARSNCKDELEFVVLDVSNESVQIGIQSRLREISKSWDDKITVKYYPYEKDPGIYNMRLDAVNYCTGDYIVCVDGDDFFKEHAFENMMIIIHNHFGYDIYEYSSDFVDELPDFSLKSNFIFKSNNIDESFDLSVLENTKISASFFLWQHIIKTDVYKRAIAKLPRFMCTYGEDIILSFVIFKESKSFYGIPDVLHVRRLRKNSDSSGKWMKRDPELILSFNIMKIVYDIIDNDDLFKPDIINNNSSILYNVRHCVIGRLRENDRQCIEQMVEELNSLNNLHWEEYHKKHEKINRCITLFENTYGDGSWKTSNEVFYKVLRNQKDFKKNLDKYLQCAYVYMIDKYGVGLGV